MFAHPDDETSGAGGTFTKYAREGVEIVVATATRGEQGNLGTGGQVISREELPAVREAELRSVLKLFGAQQPVFLGYRDQELDGADFRELVEKFRALMDTARPDVVVTFGPTGISRHEDHVAVHKATWAATAKPTRLAFHEYREAALREPRLMYVAIPGEMARRFELDIDGPEVEPTVCIDIAESMEAKLKALRMYRSQEDAQEIADFIEQEQVSIEYFHQAYPPVSDGAVASGFWE